MKDFLINSFWNIGWPDPFPDEHSAIDQDFLRDKKELVYHKTRFVPDYSPPVVFIPNKIVMAKLMRACLGVTEIEELWIY